jgi:CRP/FNR family transcriptional regulator, cyclic AMP receptor protein
MNAQAPMALVHEQPFVRGFDPHETDQLAELAREVRFATDEIIYREGEECRDFYLVVSGQVVLEITPPSGPFPFDTVEAGDEFGWTAMLGSHDRVLQARALRPTTVLAFDAARLRALCESDTAFGYDLMRRLLASAVERLQAVRLEVMDLYWPVARRAGA